MNMKKRFKKSAFFLMMLGLVIASVAGIFGFQEYQLMQYGDSVVGQVTHIVEFSAINGDGLYRPEITYQTSQGAMVFIPSWASDVSYTIGEPVDLRVSGDRATVDSWSHPGNILILVGFVTGLILFVLGAVWFASYRKHYNDIARLKRTGRRISARCIHYDEVDAVADGADGFVLHLQQENSKRTFITKPIFSKISIEVIQEQSFDVYVDPEKPTHYYIDLEKYLGHPVG